MSIEEKDKLSYLSELIIRKALFTKVEKVFHINNMAIGAASDFNRGGKILVTTSKAFNSVKTMISDLILLSTWNIKYPWFFNK